jgi:hypothetical protein
LDINSIKPERVLVDHPVNPVVAATPERATGIGGRPAEAHAKK